MASRASMDNFIKSVTSNFDGLVFAQFFFDMENSDDLATFYRISFSDKFNCTKLGIHKLKDKMNVNHIKCPTNEQPRSI